MLIEKSKGLWSSNMSLSVNYKWCCVPNCQNITNFFLEEGQIASFNGIDVITDLGDVAGCVATTGMCARDVKFL